MRLFLKKADEIIPHELFLLCNASLLLGCFIDIVLIDFRYVVINTLWLVPFSIVSILLRSNVPNKIGASAFFVIGMAEIAHWAVIGGPITAVSIITLFATNLQESLEFLSVKQSLLFLLPIPYIALFIYALRQKRQTLQYRARYAIVLLALLISAGFTLENAVNGRLVRKGVPQIVKVSFSFASQYDFFKQTENGAQIKKVSAQSETTANEIVVLIIGESLNRHHMSLYGYSRPTTPRLEKRNDLIVFTNGVSAYSSTINAVLALMSESNVENKKKIQQSIDLFDVFSSAGFETYWLSNQPPLGVWENMTTTLAKKADHPVFVNLASNSSMEATVTSSYDSRLFQPYKTALQATSKKKLIVVHLMGNHTSYENRYPNKYSVFDGDGKTPETIAEYDNSVVYNDYIVNSLLNTLQTNTSESTIASAIYLSDHGENVYDQDNQIGHTFTQKLPKPNVDIPFIVWLSEGFKNHHAKKAEVVRQNTGIPFVSDDLFHAIIDISSIETPHCDSTRSVFNKHFNSNRKRVLVDGFDYDQ